MHTYIHTYNIHTYRYIHIHETYILYIPELPEPKKKKKKKKIFVSWA